MTRRYFRQLQAGVDFGQENPFAGQMQNFVYAIGDRDRGECLLIDPAWAIDELVQTIRDDGMRIVGALVTHYHPDHIGGDIFGHSIEGLAELMAINPCKVHCHNLEKAGVQQVTGLSANDIEGHDSGDKVRAGDVEVEILHTPGHTPGSICFRCSGSLLSGDTLFLQGCGRVDLPGGDSDEMFRTLDQRLSKLPGETVVYPGHNYGGSHASMQDLRVSNPYLTIKDLESWRRVRG